MRKLRSTLLLVAAASLAAAALSATGSASAPVIASGTFHQDTFGETLLNEAGGNFFYTAHDVHTYTGTFTGTDVFDGIVEVRKDGTISWHGTSTFTGTVAGCGSGTVVFATRGGTDATFAGSCHQQVIGGTPRPSGQSDPSPLRPACHYRR